MHLKHDKLIHRVPSSPAEHRLACLQGDLKKVSLKSGFRCIFRAKTNHQTNETGFDPKLMNAKGKIRMALEGTSQQIWALKKTT